MKNALNNQVGMLGDVFLWLVANLKQGVTYFIKHALPPNISAGSVYGNLIFLKSLKFQNLKIQSFNSMHFRVLNKSVGASIVFEKEMSLTFLLL